MTSMLDQVRERWGDMAGWARDNGLTDDDLAALRAGLVEAA
jgi:hypothetical protein